MKDAQNNGKQFDPAEELENLVEDVAGYDCAYAAAKTKRETAEKALELAKAEENFEADKLRAILAAVRTKSATDAKVYDQHLRNCLGKMTTTRSDRWNEKLRRYNPEPIPGVTKWSDLAKAGASDAQIISNLKIGFDSYSGTKSGLYQLKGMQFKSILGEDDMGWKKGVTILDQKQLLAAIRRVMKIGQPKPKSPPPAKKPEQKKTPAAAAGKKAPEKKAEKKQTNGQTWNQFLATLKGANASNPTLLEDIEANLNWFKDEWKNGHRPAEARERWLKANPSTPDNPLSPSRPKTTAKKSKVKASPTPPPANIGGESAKSEPGQPGVAEQALHHAVFHSLGGEDRLQTFLRNHKGHPSDAEIGAFLGEAFGISGGFGVWSWKGGANPTLNTGVLECRNAPLIDLFRKTFRLGIAEEVPAPTLQLKPHNIALGPLSPDIFDSGTGIPDQPPEQKSSWHQWAQLVRSNPAAKDCPEWPRTQGKIFREPLVDPNDKAIRAAYLAGRKPAAAARELAAMFSKRASKADRSRSTLNEKGSEKVSEAEEKSLKGEKVGAA